MGTIQNADSFDRLIEALQILRKYGNPNRPTHCEHDTLYVVGIEPKVVSHEDRVKLKDLGFDTCSMNGEDVFYSFRYGHA